METKKILLDGFHVTFDSRALFMQEMFRYPKVRDEAVLRLLKAGELEEWKKDESATIGGGHFMRMEFTENDLIALFEKLTKHGELKKLEPKDSYMQYTCGMLKGENAEIKVELDGVLLIAYGIVTAHGCREELKNVFPEPEKYYAMFLQSQYKECKMTGCIPVEYVWDMRLVIGVLLELRQVKDKILYQKVMRVIYSGYKTLKRDLKKHSYITGNILKEINSNFKNIKQDAMQMCSQILISFILMEELNIEMMWDFSIGLLLPFIERYEHELEQGYPTDEIDDKVEEKQSEWREKFYDTYDRQLSVRSLLLEKHDDDNADAVMQVMSLFDIHPRKFEEYELTEQELRLLMAQKEKWNSKICWGAIIIAQLCKYIRALEERFLNETSQIHSANYWIEEDKRILAFKELEVLQRKIEKLEQSVAICEQTKEHLQKQIEISESKLKASQEQILNLKAFIDYSSVENPEKCEESNKEIDTSYWTEKRVLVIGGHPSWQNKLRAIFPKWQFLATEQINQLQKAMKEKEYIICNVNRLSHACYYKLLSCKEAEQKILYVRHTNIEQGLLELEGQMEKEKT